MYLHTPHTIIKHLTHLKHLQHLTHLKHRMTRVGTLMMLTSHTSLSANVHTLHTHPTPQKHLTHHLALCTSSNKLKRKLTVGAGLTHLTLYSCRHTKRQAGGRLKWVRTIYSVAHFNDPCFSRQKRPLIFHLAISTLHSATVP